MRLNCNTMNRATGRAISVIVPFTVARFSIRQVAGAKALSFAEKIISKYSNAEGFDFSGASFVFLQKSAEDANKERAYSSDTLVVLKLIMMRMVALSGKSSVIIGNENYVSRLENEISTSLSAIRINKPQYYKELVTLYNISNYENAVKKADEIYLSISASGYSSEQTNEFFSSNASYYNFNSAVFKTNLLQSDYRYNEAQIKLFKESDRQSESVHQPTVVNTVVTSDTVQNSTELLQKNEYTSTELNTASENILPSYEKVYTKSDNRSERVIENTADSDKVQNSTEPNTALGNALPSYEKDYTESDNRSDRVAKTTADNDIVQTKADNEGVAEEIRLTLVMNSVCNYGFRYMIDNSLKLAYPKRLVQNSFSSKTLEFFANNHIPAKTMKNITRAINILSNQHFKTAEEQSVFNNAVTRVYRNRTFINETNPSEMLKMLSHSEKTDALLLVYSSLLKMEQKVEKKPTKTAQQRNQRESRLLTAILKDQNGEVLRELVSNSSTLDKTDIIYSLANYYDSSNSGNQLSERLSEVEKRRAFTEKSIDYVYNLSKTLRGDSLNCAVQTIRPLSRYVVLKRALSVAFAQRSDKSYLETVLAVDNSGLQNASYELTAITKKYRFNQSQTQNSSVSESFSESLLPMSYPLIKYFYSVYSADKESADNSDAFTSNRTELTVAYNNMRVTSSSESYSASQSFADRVESLNYLISKNERLYSSIAERISSYYHEKEKNSLKATPKTSDKLISYNTATVSNALSLELARSMSVYLNRSEQFTDNSKSSKLKIVNENHEDIYNLANLHSVLKAEHNIAEITSVIQKAVEQDLTDRRTEEATTKAEAVSNQLHQRLINSISVSNSRLRHSFEVTNSYLLNQRVANVEGEDNPPESFAMTENYSNQSISLNLFKLGNTIKKLNHSGSVQSISEAVFSLYRSGVSNISINNRSKIAELINKTSSTSYSVFSDESFVNPIADESVPMNFRASEQPQSLPQPAVQAQSNSFVAQELVSEYGNLIDYGGVVSDNVLVNSNSLGGIYADKSSALAEARMALIRTSEQVEVHKTMLEEISQKQKRLEAQTLKESDIKRISEQVVRAFKDKLRNEKSRYMR